MSCLRFFAKPDDAFEQVKPAMPPQESEHTAINISTPPVFITAESSAPSSTALTRFAVI